MKKVQKFGGRESIKELSETTCCNLELNLCKYLDHMQKFKVESKKSSEFEISLDLTHKNQRNLFNFQDIGFLFLPWLSWAHLLAIAPMADLQWVIFPNLFMNFSQIVGNLSTASFNWQTNILSQGKNSTCWPWSSCTKNLENIKCRFLNSPLLFLKPNPTKN